jgi:hypothetical protein
LPGGHHSAPGGLAAQLAGNRAAAAHRLVAAQLRAQVERCAAGQQQPARDRPERRRLRRGAELGGDRGGDGVGLLGRKAALLDRERGGVARRVDAGRAAHAAVPVDRDESVAVARQALDPRSLLRRQHDDRVGVRRVAVDTAVLEPNAAFAQ